MPEPVLAMSGSVGNHPNTGDVSQVLAHARSVLTTSAVLVGPTLNCFLAVDRTCTDFM